MLADIETIVRIPIVSTKDHIGEFHEIVFIESGLVINIANPSVAIING